MPIGVFKLNSISAAAAAPAASQYHILYTGSSDPSDAWNHVFRSTAGDYYVYSPNHAMRFSSDGTITWQKSFSNYGDTGGFTTSGVFTRVTTGPSAWQYSGSTAANNWATVRTSNQGDFTIGNNAGVMDVNGNFITWANGLDTSYRVITNIVKWNSSGSVSRYRWALETGSHNQNTLIRSMAVDTSSNLYFTARDGNSNSYFLVKYNSTTVHQWSRKLDWSGNDRAHGISAGSNGYVYGASSGNYLWCINASQARLWEYTVNGMTSMDTSWSSSIDSSNNVYYYGKDASNYGYILKLDASGTQQWCRRIYVGGTLTNFRVRIVSNVMYVSGRGSVSGSGTSNFVMRLPTDGTLTGNYGPSNSFQYSDFTMTLTSVNNLTITTPTLYLNEGQVTYTTAAFTPTVSNTTFNFATPVSV